MIRLAACLALAFAMLSPAHAQSIAGRWQTSYWSDATSKEPDPSKTEKWFILDIAQSKGKLAAKRYDLDRETPEPVSSIRFAKRKLSYRIDGVSFTGEMSADGAAISGTVTANGASFPLTWDRATPDTAWPFPPKPHATSFVTSSDGVKLEVVDWGGNGRPLLLLSGFGGTAHVYDWFAARLAGKYHVYGMTRRGGGASGKPELNVTNYDVDRLADDVVAVIDALKLNRPVLAGWSFGGAELSSISDRHPDKASGLIYLDGGYGYAFYTPGTVPPTGGINLAMDVRDLQAKVAKLNAAETPTEEAARIADDLPKSLPQLQADIAAVQMALRDTPNRWARANPVPLSIQQTIVVLGATRKFGPVRLPTLAIFAHPHSAPTDLPEDQRKAYLASTAEDEAAINGFEAGNPMARVVRIPNARHAVFLYSAPQVLKEMEAFIDGLPPG